MEKIELMEKMVFRMEKMELMEKMVFRMEKMAFRNGENGIRMEKME